jgi:hypothetical protein
MPYPLIYFSFFRNLPLTCPHRMEFDFDAIDEEDSPYPEVRASVSNIDDPDMPSLTIRMWFVGLTLCMISRRVGAIIYPWTILTTSISINRRCYLQCNERLLQFPPASTTSRSPSSPPDILPHRQIPSIHVAYNNLPHTASRLHERYHLFS